MRRLLPLLGLLLACQDRPPQVPGPGSDRISPRVVLPEVRPPEVRVAEPGRVETAPFVVLPAVVRGPRQVDVFIQEQAVVDILWVVDNSASVSNERARLAAQFQRFVQVLIDAQVDFHVGVTSTDFVSQGADRGALRGTPRFIDRNTANPREVFRAAVTFPEDLDVRLEEGLRAMKAALSPPLSQTVNAGFQREEAALAVIVVSDEDDGSLGRPEQYARFLDGLKGPGREVNVSLSAVVGDLPGGCIPPGDELVFGADADAAERYLQVVRQTGGLQGSICAANFAPFVEDLATSLAGLRRFFPLSAPPGVGSVEVTVDGRPIPQSEAMGWALRAAERGVEFGGAYLPPPGAEVRISYDVAL